MSLVLDLQILLHARNVFPHLKNNYMIFLVEKCNFLDIYQCCILTSIKFIIISPFIINMARYFTYKISEHCGMRGKSSKFLSVIFKNLIFLCSFWCWSEWHHQIFMFLSHPSLEWRSQKNNWSRWSFSKFK